MKIKEKEQISTISLIGLIILSIILMFINTNILSLHNKIESYHTTLLDSYKVSNSKVETIEPNDSITLLEEKIISLKKDKSEKENIKFWLQITCFVVFMIGFFAIIY